jgi:hypothetical protein
MTHIKIESGHCAGQTYLTTESATSGRGVPVLRIEGEDFGPGDLVWMAGFFIPAADIVSAWANDPARTQEEIEAASRFMGTV